MGIVNLHVSTDIVLFTTRDIDCSDNRKVAKKGLQVLLIKRDTEPHKNLWSLPGGLILADEGLLDSAKNVLLRKTGIKNVSIEQIGAFGDVKRDSRSRAISIAYMALVNSETIEKEFKEDIKESKWFWIKDLEDVNIVSEDGEVIEQLAFDHKEIIKDALGILIHKVGYTNIALKLLPELFTIKEAQLVYEAILDKSILNFRRKLGDMVLETDDFREGKAHRPAKLFAINKIWKENKF